jgi:SAM-dependent methyltransferase
MFVLAVLVAALPFELNSLPIASSLQWLFVILAAVSLPVLFRERRHLLRDRLIIAALAFAGTQWTAAWLASEFRANAGLGALRITIGLTLLCVTLCAADRNLLLRVWSITAVVAAAYALLDHAGLGIPHFFRTSEFFAGNIRRLSGSFDYPNTAAAYFSMSLPIVWTTMRRQWLRIPSTVLLFVVLILTYSRGALVALLVMLTLCVFVERTRMALLLAGIGTAAFIGIARFEPFLLQRFAGNPIPQRFAAEYEPEFNKVRLPPDGTYEMGLRIRNTGIAAWESSQNPPFTVSYRWYDLIEKRLIYKSQDFIVIPTPVRPQEVVTMRVPFRAPHQNGLLLMTWDVSQHDKNRFRDRGVIPGLVEAEVQSGATPWFGSGDLSRWLRRDTSRIFVGNIRFSRTELWQAALQMVRTHPAFGVGPDNFRLMYGRQFGLYQWDTKLRSNNLYLELLSGSGIAGLLAFGIMMLAFRRNALVPSIAIGIFLIHGLVDVFLMTTPIYFAFWILLGLAHLPDDEPETSSAGAATGDGPLTAVYDDVAARYDIEVDGFGDNGRLRDVFRRRVSALAGVGSSILDFGCGTGSDAAWYAAQGHRVIAYDISSGMVDVLRSRCAATIREGRIVALAGGLNVLREELAQTAPVGAIAANFAVLNHVRDLSPLFRELSSHLAPGGVLVASVLNPFYQYDMKSRWWWKGLFFSIWTGSITMAGKVTTYRHFTRAIRRMAAPFFRLVEKQASTAAVEGISAGSAPWRISLDSNFQILVFRKTQ